MAFAEHGRGKSLSDVFARTPRKDGGKGFLEIDLNQIVAPSQNPRQVFDANALAELAQSILRHGILQPIVVMKRDAGYEIVSGERRYRAAKQAGLTKVPVVVREGDDQQHLAELRLIENIPREDLTPIERAQAYQALLEQHGLTHEDLAERVGKDRSSVTNALRLLALPAQIQAEVSAGTLANGHAKALLGAEPAWQLTLARRVIEEGLSVREVERLAKAGPGSAVPAAKPKPPHIKELEANLFRLFGTRVKVKEKNGKGSLTLSFSGKEHFQRVVTILDKVVKQSNQL